MNRLKLTIITFTLLLLNTQATLFGTKLHEACREGNATKVVSLIKKSKKDINKKEADLGNTALHIAVQEKHLEIVKLLTEPEESNLTIRNNEGDTAFDIACKNNYTDIAKNIFDEMCEKEEKKIFRGACKRKKHTTIIYLVEKFKFDLNKKRSSEDFPLDIACKYDATETILYIIKKLKKRKIKILFDACKDGKLKTVQHFIETLKYSIDSRDSEKNTLLHIACTNNQPEIVKYLFSQKASLDSFNNQGYNPLHCACEDNNLDIVKLLAQEYNANINILTKTPRTKNNTAINIVQKNKYTPLEIAEKKYRSYYHTQNTPDYLKKTKKKQIKTLYSACQNGDFETVIYHVETLKYPITTTWNKRNTLLHAACAYGQEEIVEYLLENGAIVNTYNNQGNSPLALAIANGHQNIVEILLKHKKNLVNKQDRHGFTALHYACWAGKLELAKLLVTHYNACINTSSKRQNHHNYEKNTETEQQPTAIELAKSEGHTDVVEFLKLATIKQKHEPIAKLDDVKLLSASKTSKIISDDQCNRCKKLFDQDESLIVKTPVQEILCLSCFAKATNCVIKSFKKTEKRTKITI